MPFYDSFVDGVLKSLDTHAKHALRMDLQKRGFMRGKLRTLNRGRQEPIILIDDQCLRNIEASLGPIVIDDEPLEIPAAEEKEPGPTTALNPMSLDDQLNANLNMYTAAQVRARRAAAVRAGKAAEDKRAAEERKAQVEKLKEEVAKDGKTNETGSRP